MEPGGPVFLVSYVQISWRRLGAEEFSLGPQEELDLDEMLQFRSPILVSAREKEAHRRHT